jgi:hypothetical protein
MRRNRQIIGNTDTREPLPDCATAGGTLRIGGREKEVAMAALDALIDRLALSIAQFRETIDSPAEGSQAPEQMPGEIARWLLETRDLGEQISDELRNREDLIMLRLTAEVMVQRSVAAMGMLVESIGGAPSAEARQAVTWPLAMADQVVAAYRELGSGKSESQSH